MEKPIHLMMWDQGIVVFFIVAVFWPSLVNVFILPAVRVNCCGFLNYRGGFLAMS